jgi:hypothetical protein
MRHSVYMQNGPAPHGVTGPFLQSDEDARSAYWQVPPHAIAAAGVPASMTTAVMVRTRARRMMISFVGSGTVLRAYRRDVAGTRETCPDLHEDADRDEGDDSVSRPYRGRPGSVRAYQVVKGLPEYREIATRPSACAR